jgi:carboxylesterase
MDEKRSAARLLPRRIRMLVVSLVLLAAILLLYSCATTYGARRSNATEDRDPATGIVRGTEALTLRPDAKNDAPPLDAACLLVHGFVGSRRDFAGLGDYLAKKGFAVRLMRLPGHGTTPSEFARLKPGALLEAVREEYANLRREHRKVYVVGFSMGGALSTLLASREPMDGLVLIAPYYGVRYHWFYVLPAETWTALLGRLAPYVRKSERFVRVNDRSQVSNIFAYDWVPTAGARQLVQLGRDARQETVLRAIRCPVLVLHSQGDFAASPKASAKAFALIGSQRKEYVSLTRSDHHLLWDYDRAEATRRVGGFLLGLARPAGS